MAATSFPELLQRFFAHMRSAREVSPHTTAAYRDTFRLLLPFIAKRRRISLDQITLETFVPVKRKNVSLEGTPGTDVLHNGVNAE